MNRFILKILHLLQNSLPLISGSTIRSKYIFQFQKKYCTPIILTSFIYKNKKNFEILDKIPYYRINKHLSKLLRTWYKSMFRIINTIYKFFSINIDNEILFFPVGYFTKRYIERIAKFYDVDIIHQHSHWEICKYSYEIAKKLNKPYIYEVRGFIEESMLANVRSRRIASSKLIQFIYNKIKNQETEIIKKADGVITLSTPMKDELIKRGVDKDKIEIIPNSIVLEDSNIEKISNTIVKIGFFGQLRWYEGIEILLYSVPYLKDYGLDVKIVIVGNSKSNYLDFLNNIIEKLGIHEDVLFCDSVPHEQIGEYYSLVDMIVIPRLDCGVCKLVTPLKPLDAMCFNTFVIGSDLPALRYNIIHAKTGALFEAENSVDLAMKIIYYHNHPKERKEIEKFARKYAEKNFTWEKVVPKYHNIYGELIKKRKGIYK